MGYERLAKLSKEQLAKHVRAAAADPACVFLTRHVRTRMAERMLTRVEIDECLQPGVLRRQPEFNPVMQSLERRMERNVLGRHIAVVAALCDEDPTVVIVTVFETN